MRPQIRREGAAGNIVFESIVILGIAFGIGCEYRVAQRLCVPLPFPHSERLLRLYENHTG